jgi:hypothetical protein
MAKDPADDPQKGNTTGEWTPSLSGHTPSERPLRPCVVLAGLDSPIPQPLHNALQQADLAPRIEHDPRMAMAEACLLRREARERAALGLDDMTSPPPLILLVSPEGAVADMVSTMKRLVPDVPVCMLVGEALATLEDPATPSPELVPEEIESLLGRPASKAQQEPA